MRYLCLLYVAEDKLPAPESAEVEQVLAANMAAGEAMAKAGVLVDSAPLFPVSEATTLAVRGGESVITDGPYAELKEQLGGYYLLECADLDEALAWAQKIPAAEIGSVEVRPVMPVPGRG